MILQLHETHKRFCFLGHQNLVFAFWDREVPLEAIRRFGKLLSHTRSKAADGFGVLVWVAPLSTGMQSRDEQEAISRVMKENTEGYRALAYVHTGDGFVGAIVRAAITAINLLARPKHQVRVFSNSRDALLWLRERSSPTLETEEVALALELEFARWDNQRRSSA